MNKLNFYRIEPTQWNLFVQKCKIVYQMLISEQFVLINTTKSEVNKNTRIEVVGFGTSMKTISELTNKAYTESINISYKDVSFATKMIKQFHGHESLTFLN